MDQQLVRLSKFMSLVLRHRPQEAGLTLDDGGWADVESLLAAMNRKGMRVDRALMDRVVAENDKQRFAFNEDGSKIRANQGHSVQVDLGLPPVTPPDLLYHGTGRQSLDSIRLSGLLKRKRHAVHLSPDAETAVRVGQRHGVPAVLVIEAGRMAADGYVFYHSANGIWLTDHVPPAYIQFP